MKKTDHINLAHSRPGQYGKLLNKIATDGVCPFCEKNLKRYHRKPIIKKTKYWILTANQNPYQGLKYHLLFINRQHLTKPSQLSTKEWFDLANLVIWAEKKYRVAGGAFFMRFGDTDYTGASVTHLHAHLVAGGKREKGKPEVKIKVGYYK